MNKKRNSKGNTKGNKSQRGTTPLRQRRSQQNVLLGDVNYDGFLNVLDVVVIVNMILGNDTIDLIADINGDGTLNVLDVILLVDIILNEETIPDTGLFISQQYEEDELTFFYDIEYSRRPNPYGVQYSSS